MLTFNKTDDGIYRAADDSGNVYELTRTPGKRFKLTINGTAPDVSHGTLAAMKTVASEIAADPLRRPVPPVTAAPPVDPIEPDDDHEPLDPTPLESGDFPVGDPRNPAPEPPAPTPPAAPAGVTRRNHDRDSVAALLDRVALYRDAGIGYVIPRRNPHRIGRRFAA